MFKQDPHFHVDDTRARDEYEWDEPVWRQKWRSLKETWAAIVALPETLKVLREAAIAVDKGNMVARLERAARVVENQSQTQRQVLDQIHSLERAVVEAGRRLPQNDATRLPPQD